MKQYLKRYQFGRLPCLERLVKRIKINLFNASNEFIKYTALVLDCCNRPYFLVIYFLEVIEFLKF